jgi:hypothetical protein
LATNQTAALTRIFVFLSFAVIDVRSTNNTVLQDNVATTAVVDTASQALADVEDILLFGFDFANAISLFRLITHMQLNHFLIF